MFNLNPKLIAVKTILDACKTSTIQQYALINLYAELIFGKDNPITKAVQSTANKKDENLCALLENILVNPELTQQWGNLTPALGCLSSDEQVDFVATTIELANDLANGAALNKWEQNAIFKQVSLSADLSHQEQRYLSSIIINHALQNYVLNATRARKLLTGKHNDLIKSLNEKISKTDFNNLLKYDNSYLSAIRKIGEFATIKAGQDRVEEVISMAAYLGGDYSLLIFFAQQWDLALFENNTLALQQLRETVPFLLESSLYPPIDEEGDEDDDGVSVNLVDSKAALGNLWKRIQISDSDKAPMHLTNQVEQIYIQRANYLKANEMETRMTELEPQEFFADEIEVDDDMLPDDDVEVPSLAIATDTRNLVNNELSNSESDKVIDSSDNQTIKQLNDNSLNSSNNELSNLVNNKVSNSSNNETSNLVNNEVGEHKVIEDNLDEKNVKLLGAEFNVLPPACITQYAILGGTVKHKGLSDHKYEMFVHRSATPDSPEYFSAFNAFKESLNAAKNVLSGNLSEIDKTRSEQDAVKRYYHRIKGSAKMYGADLLGAVALLINNLFVYRHLDCGEQNFECPGLREFVENVTGMLLSSCDSKNYPLSAEGHGIEWRVPYFYILEEVSHFMDKPINELVDMELLKLFDYELNEQDDTNGEVEPNTHFASEEVDDDYFEQAIQSVEYENNFVSNTSAENTDGLKDGNVDTYTEEVIVKNNEIEPEYEDISEQVQASKALPDIYLTSQKIYCKGKVVENSAWLKAQSNIQKQALILQETEQELIAKRAEGVNVILTEEPNIFATLHNEFNAINLKNAAKFFLEVLFLFGEFAKNKTEVPIEPYFYMNRFLVAWLEPFIEDKRYDIFKEDDLLMVSACFDSVKEICVLQSIQFNKVDEVLITRAVTSEVEELLNQQQMENNKNNKQNYMLLSEINQTCSKLLAKTQGSSESLNQVDNGMLKDILHILNGIDSSVSAIKSDAGKSYKYAKISAFKLAPEIFPKEEGGEVVKPTPTAVTQRVEESERVDVPSKKHAKQSFLSKFLGQKKV